MLKEQIGKYPMERPGIKRTLKRDQRRKERREAKKDPESAPQRRRYRGYSN